MTKQENFQLVYVIDPNFAADIIKVFNCANSAVKIPVVLLLNNFLSGSNDIIKVF